MLTQIINGKIFTPQGWLDEGSVLIRDNKILEVTNCDLALIGAKSVSYTHLSDGHRFPESDESDNQ